MHTTVYGNTVFHHNGDYSGDLIIKNVDQPQNEIRIPVIDVINFVGDIVRSQQISKLEQMNGAEVLSIDLK